MSSQSVEQFAKTAEQFCVWAEGAPLSQDVEATFALRILSNLYNQALGLPSESGEEEPVEVTHNEWMAIFKRFGSLPFNYYSQCSSPHNVPDNSPGVADLADDLADTWRDLKRGLSLFNNGHVSAACQEWRQSFWQHWGNHSAGAIYALHSWLSEGRQSAT